MNRGDLKKRVASRKTKPEPMSYEEWRTAKAPQDEGNIWDALYPPSQPATFVNGIVTGNIARNGRR